MVDYLWPLSIHCRATQELTDIITCEAKATAEVWQAAHRLKVWKENHGIDTVYVSLVSVPPCLKPACLTP